MCTPEKKVSLQSNKNERNDFNPDKKNRVQVSHNPCKIFHLN